MKNIPLLKHDKHISICLLIAPNYKQILTAGNLELKINPSYRSFLFPFRVNPNP